MRRKIHIAALIFAFWIYPCPSHAAALPDVANSEKSLQADERSMLPKDKPDEPEPLIMIKLHGVPLFMRDSQPKDTIAPQEPLENEKNALPPLFLPPPVKPRPQPPTPPTKTESAVFTPSDKMQWPLEGKITSGFGTRGKRNFHMGIDIPMPKGTSIHAAQGGVVLDISNTKDKRYRGYGNIVLLGHGNGLVTMYAHCQSVSVKKGQSVKQGDVIGTVGDTGRTTTNHLHFEVRENGKPVNPCDYLPAR
ncbi:MAG: M23 family metallopeptidase [Synergistaceae bacterium]|nr:M23 family metallopeptidase [Synergistaceae bacterium]